MTSTFKGAAKPLDDIDIVRAARIIRVGEDEIRAVLEVETLGGGFDTQGRPKALFEPHVFYRNLGEAKRAVAVNEGLAYPRWGEKPYPADSYPRILRAVKIDRPAALRSVSWGLGQILGENHKAAGYQSIGDMVDAFMDSETAQLEAMIQFIISTNLDDDLRRHDWSGFARGYNGAGYATHGYHTRLAAAFKKWQAVPDIDYALQTIGPGSRGLSVKVAQEHLTRTGYDPKGADGKFGPNTEAAVKRFQAAKGLVADGLIGPLTWPTLIPTLDEASK